MGIRFQCHHCGHPLHVKDFQAGRKGRCPECKGQFRIPLSDAQYSIDPKTNQDAADSAITSSASSSASILTTPGLATADAITQRTSSPRNPTHHRSTSTQSTSSSIDSLNSEVQSNHAQVEHGSQLEPRIDLHLATTTASSENAESPLSPIDDSQPSAHEDNGLIQPKVIAEAPSATWYVRPTAGGQYGPAPTEIMWQWLVEGRVGVDALVWRDDWPEWHPANQVFAEFFDKVLSESASNANAYDPSAFASPKQIGYTSAASSASTIREPQTTIQVGPLSSRVATHSIVTIDSQLPAAGSATIVSKREARKRSRRVMYSVAIAILLILLLGLGVGLVVVLYKQGVTQ